MENVSSEAWELWKTHQTMLINEKHLDSSNPEDRQWLFGQMEKFLITKKLNRLLDSKNSTEY